jgi:hypothetical protein
MSECRCDERLWWVSVWFRCDGSPIWIKRMTWSLDESQVNPGFDLRREIRAAEVELVTVMLRKLNSWSLEWDNSRTLSHRHTFTQTIILVTDRRLDEELRRNSEDNDEIRNSKSLVMMSCRVNNVVNLAFVTDCVGIQFKVVKKLIMSEEFWDRLTVVTLVLKAALTAVCYCDGMKGGTVTLLYVRRVDSSTLSFSLSSHRHS